MAELAPAERDDKRDDKQTPGFHVFSIRTKAEAHSSNASEADTKQYITRKSHRKSRLGCLACKVKRVKCDETRPACDRCRRSQIPCDYSAKTVTVKRSEDVKASQTAREYRVDELKASGERWLAPAPQARPLEKPSKDHSLLKHYVAITGSAQDTITCSDILTSSQGADYRNKVLRLAQEHSFLLHGMLAVAALHLMHHDVEGYRLAKFENLQIALRDFQSAIDKPIVRGQADAILLTSMMINMQYFSWVDSLDPRHSWVFSGEASRLDWMRAHLYIKPLIEKVRPYLPESMLVPIWSRSAYVIDETQGLPPELLHLCGIYDEMSREDRLANPYLETLQMLGPLMLMERGSRSMVRYVRFMNRLSQPFFDLVQVNDPVALLVLSYWFGLMCHVDFWWVQRRAKRDCTALCMYLERSSSQEIHDLLQFPAQSCGYELRSAGDEEQDANKCASNEAIAWIE